MGKKIALVYGTGEGQTRKISQYIARRFAERGGQVELLDAREVSKDDDFSHFDGVIVGASVHGGQYPKFVAKAIRRHQPRWEAMPSAFFSVSLSESDEKGTGREEVRDQIRHFLGELKWQPGLVESFAGAVPFSRYGFFKRTIMKWILRTRHGEVDTSRDYEYTDWSSVDTFVERFDDRMNREDTDRRAHRPSRAP